MTQAVIFIKFYRKENIKVKKNKTHKLASFLAVPLAVVLFTDSSFARPRPKEKRNSESVERMERKEKIRRNFERTLQLNRVQVGRLLRRVDIKTDELVTLGEVFEGKTASINAVNELLVQSKTLDTNSGKFKVVSKFLKLRASSVSELHLSPEIVKDMIKTWPEANLENFGKVLDKASEIMREGKTAELEVAFKEALKFYNLEKLYNEKCRG